MNRPLSIAASFFLLGILAADYLEQTRIGLPLCLFAGGLLCAFLAPKERRLRVPAVALIFLGAGALIWAVHHADGIGDPFSRVAETRHQSPVQVEGRVLQTGLIRSDSNSVSLVIAIDQFAFSGEEPKATQGNALVRWLHADQQPFCGERVRVQGEVSVTIGPVNPGIGGVEAYYRLQNVHTLIAAKGPEGVERTAAGSLLSPAYLASRLRAALATRLKDAMPEQILPFVYAVWLGERTGLSDNDFQAFVESGTAHILSVSGVHVSIIFLSANFVLTALIRSRKARAATGIVVVLLYALMTGASTPCVRAALMVCIYLAAELVDRDPDAPTALSIAALVFLVWNPDLTFDVGFQLSFLSIASILAFSAPLQKGLDLAYERILRLIGKWTQDRKDSRVWPLVRGTAATSLSVQVLPLPMAVRSFHVFSLSAPFTNILVIPLLTAVLWLCFAASIFCWFWPPLAQVFGYAAWPAVVLVQRVAEWSRLSYSVTTPTPLSVALLWSGAFAWLTVGTALASSRKWFRAATATGLLVLSLVLWRPLCPKPEIVFLDVGHGDAAFVCFPGGGTALIDAGDKVKHIDYGTRVVTPFLLARGFTHLDMVCISHPDSDHIGGAFSILERFSVGSVVLGPHPSTSPLEHELIALCARRGIPLRRAQQGEVWELGSGRFDVLYPSAKDPPALGENDNSLVLRIRFGNVTVLFPGDIEEGAESLLAKLNCQADLLKVPHHGSKTSSSLAFLKKVSPSGAIVSTGGREGREPVDDNVMQRYAARDIPVWRTDQEGAIRITYRGASLQIEGERKVRKYPRPRTN